MSLNAPGGGGLITFLGIHPSARPLRTLEEASLASHVTHLLQLCTLVCNHKWSHCAHR